MNRDKATRYAKEQLIKHNLKDWHIRLTTDLTKPFLGLCSYKDKCIILNAHHIDSHPEPEVINTILHEVAHALTPGESHNEIWRQKAKEIGCDNTSPCSSLSFNPAVIDAIRSGADVEITWEEEIIRRPKYTISRLQDLCPFCNKPAVERHVSDITVDKDGNDCRLITLECFHIIKKIMPKATPFHTLVSNGWKPEVAACKHEWDKTQCKKCREYKLFNFQINSCVFAEQALATEKGAGIFHEMGLGKTVIALATIKFHSDKYTPTLYVVKSAIKFQWLKEIIRWMGPEYLGQIIISSKDSVLPGLKTYIIAYDLLRRFPKERIEQLGIKCVVLDECQQIKNADSTRTQEVRNLVRNPEVKVIPLSGTPWKNRGSEFFPVLNMLSPMKFSSQLGFVKRWVNYYYEGSKQKEGGIRNVEAFREFIKNIAIRYEYNEVMDEFPEVSRNKLHVQLDTLEQKTYDDETSEFVKWYNDKVMSGEEDQIDSIELLAKMSRMRHITGLAKIPATVNFVEEFIEETDKKLCIFVHHKDVARLLYEDLKRQFGKDIEVMNLTADHKDHERFEMAEKFNKLPRVIMVASTLASGEGINLQTCSDAIMHERQWNPQNEDQAAPGRFKRIGQISKTINVTFVEAEGTIDEHLDSIVETKRKHFHEVMNKGDAPHWSESEFAKTLAAKIIDKFNKDNKTKRNITSMATFKKKQLMAG